MGPKFRTFTLAALSAAAVLAASPSIALAQKSGGILRVYHRETPPSMSIRH